MRAARGLEAAQGVPCDDPWPESSSDLAWDEFTSSKPLPPPVAKPKSVSIKAPTVTRATERPLPTPDFLALRADEAEREGRKWAKDKKASTPPEGPHPTPSPEGPPLRPQHGEP